MKKLMFLILAGMLALSAPVSAYYTPDGVDVQSNAIVYEGATKDAFETTVTPTDPTADRTITYPDADVTVGTPVDNAVDATKLADVVADNSANQACDTTCGIAGCYLGFDAGTSAFVACSSALADSCACDGATS